MSVCVCLCMYVCVLPCYFRLFRKPLNHLCISLAVLSHCLVLEPSHDLHTAAPRGSVLLGALCISLHFDKRTRTHMRARLAKSIDRPQASLRDRKKWKEGQSGKEGGGKKGIQMT